MDAAAAGLTATTLTERGGAALCGWVAIQTKMLATSANDTDTEAKTTGQLIRPGWPDQPGDDSRGGVKRDDERERGGAVEITGSSSTKDAAITQQERRQREGLRSSVMKKPA